MRRALIEADLRYDLKMGRVELLKPNEKCGAAPKSPDAQMGRGGFSKQLGGIPLKETKVPSGNMVVVGKHYFYIFAYCGLVVEIQPLNC